MTDNVVAGAAGTHRKWLGVGLGIAVLVYSVLLVISMLWIPVWLAPPYTQNTLYVYLVLLILWPILLTVAASIAFRMRWYSILATAVLVILLLITFVTLAGPYLGALIGPSAPGSECSAEPLSVNRLRYTCQTYYMGVFVFESRSGLPIMWLVERNP
jgi:hypothetical protein